MSFQFCLGVVVFVFVVNDVCTMTKDSTKCESWKMIRPTSNSAIPLPGKTTNDDDLLVMFVVIIF